MFSSQMGVPAQAASSFPDQSGNVSQGRPTFAAAHASMSPVNGQLYAQPSIGISDPHTRPMQTLPPLVMGDIMSKTAQHVVQQKIEVILQKHQFAIDKISQFQSSNDITSCLNRRNEALYELAATQEPTGVFAAEVARVFVHNKDKDSLRITLVRAVQENDGVLSPGLKHHLFQLFSQLGEQKTRTVLHQMFLFMEEHRAASDLVSNQAAGTIAPSQMHFSYDPDLLRSLPEQTLARANNGTLMPNGYLLAEDLQEHSEPSLTAFFEQLDATEAAQAQDRSSNNAPAARKSRTDHPLFLPKYAERLKQQYPTNHQKAHIDWGKFLYQGAAAAQDTAAKNNKLTRNQFSEHWKSDRASDKPTCDLMSDYKAGKLAWACP
jgi:hypothetical protein